MEITEKFCFSSGNVRKRSTCLPLYLPLPDYARYNYYYELVKLGRFSAFPSQKCVNYVLVQHYFHNISIKQSSPIGVIYSLCLKKRTFNSGFFVAPLAVGGRGCKISRKQFQIF